MSKELRSDGAKSATRRLRYFATCICARAPTARSPYLSVPIRTYPYLRRFSIGQPRARQRLRHTDDYGLLRTNALTANTRVPNHISSFISHHSSLRQKTAEAVHRSGGFLASRKYQLPIGSGSVPAFQSGVGETSPLRSPTAPRQISTGWSSLLKKKLTLRRRVLVRSWSVFSYRFGCE